MGLFDAFGDILGGVGDQVQNVQEGVQGAMESLPIDELTQGVGDIAGQAQDAVNGAAESATNLIDIGQ